MVIKNFMEDAVKDVVEILLRDRNDICKCIQCRTDIIAFALNRLPPRYVVSERGLTHAFLEQLQNSKWDQDIISVVNLGIEIISKRTREYHKSVTEEDYIFPTPVYKDNNYYYNFPHIVGDIKDTETSKGITQAKVSLTMENELVPQAEPSWYNPYTIRAATFGFYSFWPRAIQADAKNTKVFHFRLDIEHDDYYPIQKEFIIKIAPEDALFYYVREHFTERINTVYLEKRRNRH